jgi:hypothetical protein
MTNVDTLTKPATAPTSHVDCFPARPKTGPVAKARKHQRAASKLGQQIAAELSDVGNELDAATGQLADLITSGTDTADLLALIGSLDRRRTELEAQQKVATRAGSRLATIAGTSERTDPKHVAFVRTCKTIQREWQSIDKQANERFKSEATRPRTKEAKAAAAKLNAARAAWVEDQHIRLAADAAEGRYDS